MHCFEKYCSTKLIRLTGYLITFVSCASNTFNKILLQKDLSSCQCQGKSVTVAGRPLSGFLTSHPLNSHCDINVLSIIPKFFEYYSLWTAPL